MMPPLFIVGAGGFGREVAWLVGRINEERPTYDLQGFIDDDPALRGMDLDGVKVQGGLDTLLSPTKETWVAVAIGSSKVRERVVQKLSGNSNIRFATLIDPSVLIGSNVEIGEGSMICAHSILTVDIKIGKHVIINLDCTVGHDARIHDYATVFPSVNISGHVEVGRCAHLGTGTQIIQGLSIGEDSIIGAGAVVVRDIPPDCTAVGVPAKPLKTTADTERNPI